MATTYISTDPQAGNPITNSPYSTGTQPYNAAGIWGENGMPLTVNPNTPGVTTSPNGTISGALYTDPTTGATSTQAPGGVVGSSASGGAAPQVTNPHDPQQIAAWLQWLSTQPNTDPILKTPGGISYYQNVIANNPDGLTPQNTAYWQQKATLYSAGGNVGAPSGGGNIGSLGAGGFGGIGPAQIPTLAQAQNMPGIQFAEDQAQRAIQSSAAAKGDLLTGGTLRDLAQYTAGTALNQGYLPLAQLGLGYSQFNNQIPLNIAQLGLNASGVGSA